MSTVEGQPRERSTTHIVDSRVGRCTIYQPEAIEAGNEVWIESTEFVSKGEMR